DVPRLLSYTLFFSHDTASTEFYTLSLHDALPICGRTLAYGIGVFFDVSLKKMRTVVLIDRSHHKFPIFSDFSGLKLSTILKEHRSEEHTSELQSRENLVCRLLLEKKNKKHN